MRILSSDNILRLKLPLYSETVFASWMEVETTPEGWTPVATIAGIVIGKKSFEGIYPSSPNFPPPVVPAPEKWEEITASEAKAAWKLSNPVLIEGLRFSSMPEVAWWYRNRDKRVVTKGISARISVNDFLSATSTVRAGLEFRFFTRFGN